MPKKSESYNVQPLSRKFDREKFDCEIEPLNIYLQKYALQSDKKSASRTFVLSNNTDPKRILGYYTLVNAVISFEELPKKYSKKYKPRMPGVNLARLAVDSTKQGNGYGSILLIHALNNILAISEMSGAAACFVDAKDGAKDFYLNYGFIPLASDINRMFFPIKLITALLGK